MGLWASFADMTYIWLRKNYQILFFYYVTWEDLSQRNWLVEENLQWYVNETVNISMSSIKLFLLIERWPLHTGRCHQKRSVQSGKNLLLT